MERIDEDHLFNGLKGDLRLGPRGNTGHIVRLKLEAQMCSNITGPYNSPPLIRAQFSRTNQGVQEAIVTQEVQ